MGQMGYPRELRLYGVLRSSAKWNSRSSTHSRVSWRWTELDRWRGSEEDQRTLTEQHGEKKVRSFAESAIFYVGIPAALLYPLGVGIQMWVDPLFPYSRLDTVRTAVSLVPEKVVIGTGIRLLF